jgi:hypothetical protein
MSKQLDTYDEIRNLLKGKLEERDKKIKNLDERLLWIEQRQKNNTGHSPLLKF